MKVTAGATKHGINGDEVPYSFEVHGISLAAVAITLIKTVHTLIFLYMGSCVLNILYSDLTNRISRLTKVSLTMVTLEGLIFFGNGRRCPLTKLVENLGSGHGTAGDIFLPSWLARRIPLLSSTLVAIGVAAMGLHRVIDVVRQRRMMKSA